MNVFHYILVCLLVQNMQNFGNDTAPHLIATIKQGFSSFSILQFYNKINLMDNNGRYQNFCVDLNIQLDIFDFFNRNQLLRLIFVNRQFNHLIEEYYPTKPFIYAELRFLRHFYPPNGKLLTKSNENEWDFFADHYIPSEEERKKIPKIELYFGGIYMFHLTALNCCCEQNFKQLLGWPKMFCYRTLELYDFSPPSSWEQPDLNDAMPTFAATLHKNCTEWTKMDWNEVKNCLQIRMTRCRISPLEYQIYWKHEVHDEPTRNLLIHEFYCAHRNSDVNSFNYSPRYEGNGIKRCCPGLELLTENFALIQQHLKHPFVRIMKLDLLEIMKPPEAEIISNLNISRNLFCHNHNLAAATKEGVSFYWHKFAFELNWLIQNKKIHPAACVDIDLYLLSTFISYNTGVKEIEGTSSNSNLKVDEQEQKINIFKLVQQLGHCAELRLGFCEGTDADDFDDDVLLNNNLAKMFHGPLFIQFSSVVHKTKMINALLHLYNPNQDPHRLISFYNFAKKTESNLLQILIDDFLDETTSPCTFFANLCTIIIEGKQADYYNHVTNEFLLISPVIRYSMNPTERLNCLITRGNCCNEEIKAEAFSLHSQLRQDVKKRFCLFLDKYNYPSLGHEYISKYKSEEDVEIANDRRDWLFFSELEGKDTQGKNIVSSIGPFLRHIFANNSHRFPREMYNNDSMVDLDRKLLFI